MIYYWHFYIYKQTYIIKNMASLKEIIRSILIENINAEPVIDKVVYTAYDTASDEDIKMRGFNVGSHLINIQCYDINGNLIIDEKNIKGWKLKDIVGKPIANIISDRISYHILNDTIDKLSIRTPKNINDVEEINSIAKQVFTPSEYHPGDNGFILTDGTFVKLTTEEHEDLQRYITGVKLDHFLELGNIRISSRYAGNNCAIEIWNRPTFEQRSALYKPIGSTTNLLGVEVYDPETGDSSFADYADPDPRIVLNQIDRYYNEGIDLEEQVANLNMLQKLLTETMHNILLEYASKNNEVTEASNRLCNVIYQLYEQLLETHQDIFEGDTSNTIKLVSKARYAVKWGELPIPKSNIISVSDVGFFNKEFDLNILIFFIDRKNLVLTPKYELALKRSVHLGSVSLPGMFDIFTNPSINLIFTSSMIENGSFRNVVEHELMHAFQTDKEKIDKNGKIYHHDIKESMYNQLQFRLSDYKHEDNVKFMLRLLYLLEPTEKSAWMQGVISELQQSYENLLKGIKIGFFDIDEVTTLQSNYYNQLKHTFSQFRYMLDTDDPNEMVYRLSEYLSQYVPFHQHAARKIVRDFLDYSKKINKIYYQHNTDLLNKLRDEITK